VKTLKTSLFFCYRLADPGLSIGGCQELSQDTRNFIGDIDDFALFDHPMRLTEAANVYYGLRYDASATSLPVTAMAPLYYPSWSRDFFIAFGSGILVIDVFLA
jgi:hypothetical protein